jgi:alkylation response protein AidB-like acyl-CoA dehydrogenase
MAPAPVPSTSRDTVDGGLFVTDAFVEQLADDEAAIVEAVRSWVDKRVVPAAHELEQRNEFPGQLIEQMKEMGIYGLLVPAEYGGSEVSPRCFALVTEELARGWMSLAGAMGGHSVVVSLLSRFGTPDQQAAYLPRLATGEIRATMALTEPGGGSDLQAMRTVASRRADGSYLLRGSKTWISNAERAGLHAVLCKTDPDADPPYRGISILLVEPGPGLEVGRSLGKLGYRGVESCEVYYDDATVPAQGLLGGAEGAGFSQMMQGLEVGRIQVAARATGVARAALDAALAYSRERHSFGVPIWQHQAIGHRLADMATKLTAARALLLLAADRLAARGSANLEAGMAKLYASEVCAEITLGSVRVHGGMGYSTELDVERYYRDAPLMIVGEGTNEIQRNVIAKALIRQGLP